MKNVLLATDGSTNAEEAARFCSHLPHDDKLKLTVLTVLETPYVNLHYPSADWIAECVERDRSRAIESYQKIATYFEGANVTLDHLVRSGDRASTIVEVAESIGADLVVVGARGHSAVARLLLGSVSDYVSTHAPCSVLVVRPKASLQLPRPLRIAVAFEDSGPALAAIDEFAEIPWGPETEVHVVTVLSYLAGVFHQELFDAAATRTAARTAAAEALKRIQESAPRAVTTEIENEHIGEGLVAFADANDTDLIIVGETSRSTLGRLLMGSVSRYVLRHAPCSVWITRNRMIESEAEDNSDVVSPADST